jgi:predicted acetyltransferase
MRGSFLSLAPTWWILYYWVCAPVAEVTPILTTSFQFLEPFPLVDQELELVAPQRRYLDEVLAACRHPLTLQNSPDQSRVTRESLLDFLKAAPLGRHPGDSRGASAPSYHFWMRLNDASPVRIAGGIGLRIGDSPNIVNLIGHIGYHVYPAVRGRHLAERSCRLLLPLARQHGLKALWITCNPDNLASRRTCERLGATLVDTVPVPTDHELYSRGERQKCRYRLDL